MKILILSENSEDISLCKQAFDDAAHDFTTATPAKTISGPAASDTALIGLACENIFMASQTHPDANIYVSIEHAPVIGDQSITTIYALAVGYRELGLPITTMSLRRTNDAEQEILAGLRTLTTMPRTVPSINELANLPPYI